MGFCCFRVAMWLMGCGLWGGYLVCFDAFLCAFCVFFARFGGGMGGKGDSGRDWGCLPAWGFLRWMIASIVRF